MSVDNYYLSFAQDCELADCKLGGDDLVCIARSFQTKQIVGICIYNYEYNYAGTMRNILIKYINSSDVIEADMITCLENDYDDSDEKGVTTSYYVFIQTGIDKVNFYISMGYDKYNGGHRDGVLLYKYVTPLINDELDGLMGNITL